MAVREVYCPSMGNVLLVAEAERKGAALVSLPTALEHVAVHMGFEQRLDHGGEIFRKWHAH